MTFTTHGPKFIGDLATVFFRDPEGRSIPVLDLIQGEGSKVDGNIAGRLAENIVSTLNGKTPDQAVNAPGVRVKWTRQSRGFNVIFQQGEDLSKKTGVLAMFNDACPLDLIRQASDRLAEQNGLAEVLDMVTMHRPQQPRPDHGHRPSMA